MKKIKEIIDKTIGIRCSTTEEKLNLLQLLKENNIKWVSGKEIDGENETELSIFPYYINAEATTVGKGNGYMFKYSQYKIINYSEFLSLLKSEVQDD